MFFTGRRSPFINIHRKCLLLGIITIGIIICLVSLLMTLPPSVGTTRASAEKVTGSGNTTPYLDSTTWFLAEGYTAEEFDTWVLVQNPGQGDASVTLEFQLPPGSFAEPHTFDLPAGTRKSIPLDELPGLSATDVSTKVTATRPVVAERAMYFNYKGNTGGHGSGGYMPTELFETTKFMDESQTELITSVSEDGSEVKFSGSNAFLESLTPGDVIMSGITGKTPRGLLLKVTGIERKGGETVLNTEPAALTDAVRNGEFFLSEELDSDDVVSQRCMKGVSLKSGEEENGNKLELFVEATWGALNLQGYVLFSNKIESYLKIVGRFGGEKSEVSKFDFKAYSRFTVDCFRLSGGMGKPVEEKYILLGTYTMKSIPIGPYVYTPVITLGATAAGSIDSNFMFYQSPECETKSSFKLSTDVPRSTEELIEQEYMLWDYKLGDEWGDEHPTSYPCYCDLDFECKASLKEGVAVYVSGNAFQVANFETMLRAKVSGPGDIDGARYHVIQHSGIGIDMLFHGEAFGESKTYKKTYEKEVKVFDDIFTL